ncbi:MAG: hydrogenase maturation protease [Candidatus Heimdallarchaeaceae archaeon]
MKKALVVAIGSTIMADDAISHHVLQNLKSRKVDANLVELGTDIFRLNLEYTGQKKVIIIDALFGEEPPGTVLVYHYDEIQEKLEGKIKNAHLLGVGECLEIMRHADKEFAKADITLVGIVAEKIDVSMELSPSVQSAIEKATEVVISLLEEKEKLEIS